MDKYRPILKCEKYFQGLLKHCRSTSFDDGSLKLDHLLFYFQHLSGGVFILFHKHTQSVPGQSNSDMLEKEIKGYKIISLIMLACLVFFILPNLALEVLSYYGLMSPSLSGIYVSFAACWNMLLSFPIYMWKDKALRQRCRQIMSKSQGQTTLVVPIRTASTRM